MTEVEELKKLLEEVSMKLQNLEKPKKMKRELTEDERKEKKREYNKRCYEKNKEKWREYHRIKSREYYAKKKANKNKE